MVVAELGGVDGVVREGGGGGREEEGGRGRWCFALSSECVNIF